MKTLLINDSALRKVIGSFFILLAFLANTGCSNLQKDWQTAEKLDTIEGYTSFLKKYPQSQFAEPANKKIIELKRSVIIPVQAIDNESGPSISRFLVFIDKNRILMARGKQDMRIQMSFGMHGQMISNNWGEGAEHGFLADLDVWGNERFSASIKTDPSFPLTLKVTDEGYAYLCGKGSVTVKGGETYELGKDLLVSDWIFGLDSNISLLCEGSCEAVARLGIKEAIPKLLQLINDPNWVIRRNACEALGILGDNYVIEQLSSRLNDEDQEVREAATKAIKRIRISSFKDESEFMFQTRPMLSSLKSAGLPK